MSSPQGDGGTLRGVVIRDSSTRPGYEEATVPSSTCSGEARVNPDTAPLRAEGRGQCPGSQAAHGRAARRRFRASRREANMRDRRAMAEEALSLIRAVAPHWGDSRGACSRLEKGFELRCRENGVEFGLLWLKQQSATSRTAWVLEGGDGLTGQISFLGRSLPRGTTVQGTEALARHKADLLSEFAVDTSLLKRASIFAKRWGRRYLGSPNRMASPGLANTSSCSQATLREGGLRGYAARLGIHPQAYDLASANMNGFPPQDVESVTIDISPVLHAVDSINSERRGGPQLPPSVPVALRERGLKIRVITKSPAELHFLGHPVRKRLLAGLRKTPSSRSPLLGVTDEALRSHFVGARAEVVVSTDLTRASDLLPLSLVDAILGGLQDSGRFPPVEVEALRLVLGPQRVQFGESTETTKRGILMGLPCTWAILSLIHLWWWDEAVRGVALEKRVSLDTAFKENRYVICGDDALFVGWSATAERYKEIIRSCGGEPSPGKHFESRGKRLRGVFLERLFEFTVGMTRPSYAHCASEHVVEFDRVPALPLRGLVRPDVPRDFKELGSAISFPREFKYLFAIDSAWQSCAGLKDLLLRILDTRFRWLRELADKFGLVSGLHIAQGGSGLPTRDLDHSAKVRRYQVALLDPIIGGPFSLVRAEVDPLWAMAGSMSEADSSAFLLDSTFVITNDRDERSRPPISGGAPYVYGGTVRDLADRSQSEVFTTLLSTMGPMAPWKPRVSWKKLQKLYRSWVKTLPALPEGANLDNPPLPVEKHVWIRRTWTSEGRLLYPRWVGETESSEASARASAIQQALGALPGFTPVSD